MNKRRIVTVALLAVILLGVSMVAYAVVQIAQLNYIFNVQAQASAAIYHGDTDTLVNGAIDITFDDVSPGWYNQSLKVHNNGNLPIRIRAEINATFLGYADYTGHLVSLDIDEWHNGTLMMQVPNGISQGTYQAIVTLTMEEI